MDCTATLPYPLWPPVTAGAAPLLWGVRAHRAEPRSTLNSTRKRVGATPPTAAWD